MPLLWRCFEFCCSSIGWKGGSAGYCDLLEIHLASPLLNEVSSDRFSEWFDDWKKWRQIRCSCDHVSRGRLQCSMTVLYIFHWLKGWISYPEGTSGLGYFSRLYLLTLCAKVMLINAWMEKSASVSPQIAKKTCIGNSSGFCPILTFKCVDATISNWFETWYS